MQSQQDRMSESFLKHACVGIIRMLPKFTIIDISNPVHSQLIDAHLKNVYILIIKWKIINCVIVLFLLRRRGDSDHLCKQTYFTPHLFCLCTAMVFLLGEI
jgi:hypothetical protein